MSLTNPDENLPPLFTASVSIHPGSLPSPEAVERYELVMSGAFDRILTMAEQEQQSKHELNMESLRQYTAKELCINNSSVIPVETGIQM